MSTAHLFILWLPLVLSWPRSLLLLVPALLLGFPVLLAGWALWRLRSAPPAGGLLRAYLLANYAAAVQLSNLRGEQALAVLRFIVQFQWMYVWGTLCMLILWRSVPVGILLASVAIGAWIAYYYIGPVINKYFRTWQTATAHAAYPPTQSRAWGLLGHGCFAGSFMFVFIGIILREYFK